MRDREAVGEGGAESGGGGGGGGGGIEKCEFSGLLHAFAALCEAPTLATP